MVDGCYLIVMDQGVGFRSTLVVHTCSMDSSVVPRAGCFCLSSSMMSFPLSNRAMSASLVASARVLCERWEVSSEIVSKWDEKFGSVPPHHAHCPPTLLPLTCELDAILLRLELGLVDLHLGSVHALPQRQEHSAQGVVQALGEVNRQGLGGGREEEGGGGRGRGE